MSLLRLAICFNWKCLSTRCFTKAASSGEAEYKLFKKISTRTILCLDTEDVYVCRVDVCRCDVGMKCGKRRFEVSLFAGAVPGLISRILLDHILLYDNPNVFNVVILVILMTFKRL
jgi:hypothetical protein